MHIQNVETINRLPSLYCFFHLETKSNKICGVSDKYEFASENGLVSM